MEELDPPGQLPGDPEAAPDSSAGCEIAGGWIVEAGASVDDLAYESAVGAFDPDLLDLAAVSTGVGRDLGGGEQQVERFRFAESGVVELGREERSDLLGVVCERDRSEVWELFGEME